MIRARTVETTSRATSVQAWAVYGDPVVTRALALVLRRGTRYHARSFYVCLLGKSGSLDDARLLLVGPTQG